MALNSAAVSTTDDATAAQFNALRNDVIQHTHEGTDTAYLTADAIKTVTGSRTLSLPTGATDTIVTLTATQTLTGKTLTAPIINAPSSSGQVYGDVYTPTLTEVLNVGTAGTAVCQFLRVGDVVTVSGRLTSTSDAASIVNLGVSLPIASNFATTTQCAGTVSAVATATGITVAGSIYADVTNNRAQFEWIPADTGDRGLIFTFTYLIV